MSYKMPQVGDYMICHTDLIMESEEEGEVAAKKGRAYKVEGLSLSGDSWWFVDELDDVNHYIDPKEDEWFRPASEDPILNQQHTYTEEELKDWCAKACEWCADVVPEYRTFNAFWEANKQK